MANKQHLNLIKQGIAYWNHWRDQYPNTMPDLSRADLSGTYMVGANLKGVNFFGSNLEAANLSRADIEGAYFRGAKLDAAIMPNGQTYDLTAASEF
ncbi:MAG: pentapeptide repeat-containing protein [Cyanothece sp. SIO1E1]|nr:pentapeptide repeat-containing protein [Cyanothece sp. SIO1E1]